MLAVRDGGNFDICDRRFALTLTYKVDAGSYKIQNPTLVWWADFLFLVEISTFNLGSSLPRSLFFKIMKALLLLLVLFGSSVIASRAQEAMALIGDPERIGSLYAVVSHVDVRGTPFLYDEWESGTVLLKDGTRLQDIRLKYNVADDLVVYTNDESSMWRFLKPVQSFTLDGYGNFVRGTGGFYQVLVEGEYPLYKRYRKSIFEQRPYGGATVEKKFKDEQDYYAGPLDNLEKIKINKSSAAKVFGSQTDQLNQALKTNKLKNENDLIALFEKMNGL